MKFLKLRPEQWLLFAMLVLLGAASIFKALFLPEKTSPTPQDSGANVPVLDAALYAGMADHWARIPALAVMDHKIFVSRVIVYHPATGKIEWLNPKEPMDDGITPEWKMKYGFPIEDPKVADADADGDGFSNKEEYLGGTDPLDPNSRPPIIVKLRVAGYNYVPFRMVFKAANKLQDGTIQFQINLLDVAKNRTRFVKKDDEVEGYKVGDYREKVVEEFNKSIGGQIKVDRSELDIINTKLNEITTLVLNTQKESDESMVSFVINVPNKTIEPAQVKRGDSFKLDENSYQVLKASAKGATIKDLKTGDSLEIPAQSVPAAPAATN